MTRIKIEDLPKDAKINKSEMRKVVGGGSAWVEFGDIWVKFGHFGYQDVSLPALKRLRAGFK